MDGLKMVIVPSETETRVWGRNDRRTLSVSETLVRVLSGATVVAQHPRSYDRGRKVEHSVLSAAALIEHVRDGFGRSGAARESLADREIHRARVVALEQAKEAARRAAEVAAAKRDLFEQRGGTRARRREPVSAAKLGRALLLGGEIFEVRAIRRFSK